MTMLGDEMTSDRYEVTKGDGCVWQRRQRTCEPQMAAMMNRSTYVLLYSTYTTPAQFTTAVTISTYLGEMTFRSTKNRYTTRPTMAAMMPTKVAPAR